MHQCPICGTYYPAENSFSVVPVVDECGGKGKCPAREAGSRPSSQHVLCACNRRWLSDVHAELDGHEYEDCKRDGLH